MLWKSRRHRQIQHDRAAAVRRHFTQTTMCFVGTLLVAGRLLQSLHNNTADGLDVAIDSRRRGNAAQTTELLTDNQELAGSGRGNVSEMPLRMNDDYYNKTGPCSMDYWLSRLPHHDLDMLQELPIQDIRIVHVTFSVGGTADHLANDHKNGTHNRKNETHHSVACCRKTLPNVAYESVDLGDFGSYQEALVGQHKWFAQKEIRYGGTVVIDTDVYANPFSSLTAQHLTRALKNVDMALVYNPNRGGQIPHGRNKINLQEGGLQGGLIAQRHNVRTQLFHGCVAHVLHTTKFTYRQQQAVNRVLELPIAQFVRVRWLPPEFHCWSPKLESISEFVVSTGPRVQDAPCFFIHSHNLARKGGLDGVC